MGINRKGNTEKVLSADIKSLHCCPDLKITSINKSITRHYVNLHLILPHTELTLINFLVFISDSVNVFSYSTELLEQFTKASSRAADLYKVGAIKYNVSVPSLRNAFIGLVEKGLLVPLKNKGMYMVCPSLVYSSNRSLFSGKKILRDYQNCYNSPYPSLSLKSMCQDIKETMDKELLRTNVNLRKENEAKNNTSKGQ